MILTKEDILAMVNRSPMIERKKEHFWQRLLGYPEDHIGWYWRWQVHNVKLCCGMALFCLRWT